MKYSEFNSIRTFENKLFEEQKNLSFDSFNDWVSLLFEQAQLAAGSHLEDPAGFVIRMNRLLES